MTDLDARPVTPPTAPTSMPRGANEDPRMPRLGRSAGFTSFIAGQWGEPERPAPVVAGAADAAAAHRARLSAAFPGAAIVVAGGRAPARVNDCYYDFRPHSDFAWLTGCTAEDAVLVMTPAGSSHDATLYLPAPFGPGEERFFADATYGELWVGAAPRLADWQRALDVPVRDLSDLEAALARTSEALVGGHRDWPPALERPEQSTELTRVLAELRMVKDAWEIAQLRQAVDATVLGFGQTVREIPTAIRSGGERWLQGTFDRAARTFGNGPGYASIVGSGPHAPTLHWVRADGPVLPDELLLLDMGVEVDSLYTADVTRTFPASGRFSEVQRRVHDLVERSHRAGLDAVRPGRPYGDFFEASMQVIAQGLHDWDLLPVSVDEALSPDGQQHRRWLVCGIGHHLGLDVHDCARSSYEAYQGGTLEPGMVMTVEPGLYFHAHDLSVPPELRGIGVRLEDDVLVTERGSEVLSAALPIDAAGIETWMAKPG
ncbi:aminopeptidase P family protein [Nocardioides sp. Iso805N]|uniref:aminopeptidase P family protein n=1 Tax=Nocardioides sp. Iso805N TaxID=1283287 RepID=UPI000381A8EF|nr:aminopeptidase P family protein [Nocardioides sp. Iso805N]